MRRTEVRRLGILIALLLVAVVALVGCGSPAAAAPAESTTTADAQRSVYEDTADATALLGPQTAAQEDTAQAATDPGEPASEEPPAEEPSTIDEASPEPVTEVNEDPASVEGPSTEAVVAEQASVDEPTADAASEGTSEEPASHPAIYVVQAGDTLAAIAREYGVTVEAVAAANGIQDPDAIYTGQTLAIPDPAQVPAAVDEMAASSAPAGAIVVATTASLPALAQVPDTDPGPPLTIEVSANCATQDPLVEGSQRYEITGLVRNDGDQTYAVSAIHVTFFDASGFRGTFVKFPGRGTGGEWVWHGRTEAEFAALLLAPGEEWPFRVAITAQDMASFLVHPDALATERVSAPVALSDVRVVDDGTGYLRVTGRAMNTNSFAVKNVTVSGVLLDGSGQIVGVGSTYVLEEDVPPGASVEVDVRIARAPFVEVQLYAQAERDWE